MSKYRHWWRPTVERAIRQYPELKELKQELMKQSVTASYSGMPRGGKAGRSTENAALRDLTTQENAIIEAVEAAFVVISGCRDGDTVLRIVELVDFKKQYTVAGAAVSLNVSLRTATDKRTRFVDAVGKIMGYL